MEEEEEEEEEQEHWVEKNRNLLNIDKFHVTKHLSSLGFFFSKRKFVLRVIP